MGIVSVTFGCILRPRPRSRPHLDSDFDPGSDSDPGPDPQQAKELASKLEQMQASSVGYQAMLFRAILYAIKLCCTRLRPSQAMD